MEQEDNHPIYAAQDLAITDGSIVVSGVLGQVTDIWTEDLDFFTFFALEGDIISIHLQGKDGLKSMDTVLGLFSVDNGYSLLRSSDDIVFFINTDSLIENYRVESTGYYTVGVSSFPRYFQYSGGGLTWGSSSEAGDYTMTIRGVSAAPISEPAVTQVNIMVKPGSDDVAPLNPKSRGKIPVAILSHDGFDAMDVEVNSLRFGASGEEESLSHCGRKGEDVNNDGLADLVCHFQNRKAGFSKGDLEGILTGHTRDNQAIEGHGLLKVLPVHEK